MAQAQLLNMTVKVIDDKEQSMPGITMLVKGTSAGTMTDDQGIYTLPNVPSIANNRYLYFMSNSRLLKIYT